MKKICGLLLLLFFAEAAIAETWIQIGRYDEPKISQMDPSPYSTYLDTDFLVSNEKWILIRVKNVYEASPGEHRGKMDLTTYALSCEEFVITQTEQLRYANYEGKHFHEKQLTPKEQWDQWPYRQQIFRGPIRNYKDSPMAHMYRFACHGVKPTR
jgi:hypothetical protein